MNPSTNAARIALRVRGIASAEAMHIWQGG